MRWALVTGGLKKYDFSNFANLVYLLVATLRNSIYGFYAFLSLQFKSPKISSIYFFHKNRSLYMMKLCWYFTQDLLRYSFLLFHTKCVMWYIPFNTFNFKFSFVDCIWFMQSRVIIISF